MTYIRSKMINGCGPYYYEVRSVREGSRVRQIHIRYVGKTPSIPSVAAPQPTPKPYLEVEGVRREEPKGWDRLRTERARKIARTTHCNMLQADALAKAVLRVGGDPDTYDWDELQGADLSYEDKLDRISSRSDIRFQGDDYVQGVMDDELLDMYRGKLSSSNPDFDNLSYRRQVNLARKELKQEIRDGEKDYDQYRYYLEK